MRIITALFVLTLLPAVYGVAAEDGSGEGDDVTTVLEVDTRLTAELLKGNTAAVREMLSDQFIATDPSNTVRSKDDLIAVISQGVLVYDSFETEVDVAKQLGRDLVVLTGVETSTQSAVPTTGELERSATKGTLKRRFTNLYRKEGATWRLLLKQSTIIAIE